MSGKSVGQGFCQLGREFLAVGDIPPCLLDILEGLLCNKLHLLCDL